ncbi:hypothetical protein [uncultured Arthrobacter sp.]|uniref:hypothetical protein n=1 Tax=uncultured Arthrobacter sp. TaxID=114050 RepID=UPI00261A55D6|nr:hypothetical protein [uncultured Arthrobacter sp.]
MTNAGGHLPVIPPADVDGIARVIGGVGGIRFQWEELDRGAQIVRNAAEELRRIWLNLTWIEMRFLAARTMGNVLAAGVPSAAGMAAAEGIRAGLQRVSEGSSTLEETADKIARSRMAYEFAEFATTDHLSLAVANLLPSAPYVSRPLLVERTRTDSIPLEGTMDGLLSRVSPAKGEPGSSFEVLEVAGESGPTYVVVIPGTEGADPALPFSAGGIVEAKFEDSEYINDAVASALVEVGAENDADVMLVGYSQGGMHAVNLANSGKVSENYSVNLVLTAGSPITEEKAPEGTTFLHLAHKDDRVPTWNFAPPADRPNQVSVVLDHNTGRPEWEDSGFGPPHNIDSYRHGAQAVDESSHPSIAPITAALGAAVTGATARRHVFQITRPPLINPQLLPAAPAHQHRQVKEGSAPGAGDRARDK